LRGPDARRRIADALAVTTPDERLRAIVGDSVPGAFVERLGGGAGFFNVIRTYPARSVGIAVMGNATKYAIDAVARLAIE
jgi:hypothetical protein